MTEKFNLFDRTLRCVVIGASGGLGSAFVSKLAEHHKVYALSRSQRDEFPESAEWLPLDLEDEASIETAAGSIGKSGDIDLVLIATGLLHDGTLQPEKDWRQIEAKNMAKLFAINTIGPALVMKHFAPLLPKKRASMIAALSARVGSISDNRLGGWYGYRASKAALNQMIKTFSIELSRKRKEAIIIGLHPGTVETRLSEPFQNNSYERFSTEQSAQYLLDVVHNARVADSGHVLDWAGKRVPD